MNKFIFKSCLFSVLLAVLCGELLSLYVLPPSLPRETKLLGFFAPPNIAMDDTEINSMGFSGDEISQLKPSSTIRILLLGGSAIFERDIAGKLKQDLQSRTKKKIEVLNAAIRMHTSRASLLKMRRFANYNFDYVIVYHAINDLWANHAGQTQFRKDYGHLNPWYVRGPILDNSLLAREFYNRFFAPKTVSFHNYEKRKTNKMNFASVQTFKENISEIIKIAKEKNAQPILMSFAYNVPEVYNLEKFDLDQGRSFYGQRDKMHAYPVELWGPVDFVKEGIEKNNQVTKELAENYKLHLIDQQGMLSDDVQWFYDICHFNELGTKRFVNNIAEYFTTHNLL